MARAPARSFSGRDAAQDAQLGAIGNGPPVYSLAPIRDLADYSYLGAASAYPPFPSGERGRG